MKVIGAGLPRTATTTQLVVLEQLGFGPCYHMRNLMMDFETGLPLWEAVMEGNPDWETIFGDAQSTVDWPSARFYKDLMEYYPDAKVLLSVRSGEGWARSMLETIAGLFFGDSLMAHVSKARTHVDPLWKRYLDLMGRMNWDPEVGALAGDPETEEGLIAIMERWNAEVQETVPAERLLVWDPKDGWGPLCEFLEVPVPDGEVPRLNDTESFKAGITGGSIQVLSSWWAEQQKPEHGLHGRPVD